jgi:hypothetical protein
MSIVPDTGVKYGPLQVSRLNRGSGISHINRTWTSRWQTPIGLALRLK